MFRCVLWEGYDAYCRLYLLPADIAEKVKIEEIWRERKKWERLTANDLWNDRSPEWVENYLLLPSVVLSFEVFLKPPTGFLPVLFFYKQEKEEDKRGILLPDEKEIRRL